MWPNPHETVDLVILKKSLMENFIFYAVPIEGLFATNWYSTHTGLKLYLQSSWIMAQATTSLTIVAKRTILEVSRGSGDDPEILWNDSGFLYSEKAKNVSFFGIKISGLRQLKATESPLNIKNNAFYFTLKAFFVLQILKYLLRMFSYELDRSSHQRCSGKKVFLEIHSIHRKTPVPETLF